MRIGLSLIFISLLTIAGLKIPSKPNIIIILADDLGYGELGCYGQAIIKTPHIDKLALNGMRFKQYYAGNTVCAPSRCALLTGKHTGHCDIRDNFEMGGFPDNEEKGQQPMQKNQFTIAHLLKEYGYRTAVIGKWGLGMPNNEGSPVNAGFDFFYGYADQKQAHNYYPSHLWINDRWDILRNEYFSPHQKISTDSIKLDNTYVENHYAGPDYAPDLMRRQALKFIDEQKDPFFLFYTLPMPHLGLQIPLNETKPYTYLPDTPYLGQRQYLPQAHPRAVYAAMISRLDTEVGMIMNKLKEKGKVKNTIIIFISDNGATVPGIGGADTRFFKSNGELKGYKMDLYEGGIRVPCIVSWPGKIKAGSTTNTVVAAWDWLNTIADLTGIKKQEGSDGISIKPILYQSKDKQTQRQLYWEYQNGRVRALRQGDWKLIRFSRPKRNELYFLQTDPEERNNLTEKYPDKVKELEVLMWDAHQPSRISAWNVYE